MTGMLERAFAGRSVFVTGHTGFKGSWLAIWLSRLGARVTGYALAPATTPSNFAASGVGELLSQHHEADIRDVPRLTAAMAVAAPDVVFHLAAQSLVGVSYAAPRETFEINVVGTAAVLDAVRSLAKPCAVIVVTSDKCYANREQVWGYREVDALGGNDPYSASKGAAEIVTASYRQSYFPPGRLAEHGVQIATVRAGNAIGGGDWAADRIVPDVVRSVVEGKAVPLRNPRAVRPWQHVLEPLGGYLRLASRMLQSPQALWCDAWNFGPRPEDELPVARLVEMALAQWPGNGWQDCGGHHEETQSLRLNVEKSMVLLGWRPRWTLTETVRHTVQWYRRFYLESRPSMLDVCLENLAAYERAGEEPRCCTPSTEFLAR